MIKEWEELNAKATKGSWFKRYCDDDNHMCMTVISSKDYGQSNNGQFKEEPDTVAITFHQIAPVIGNIPDFNDATTDLIVFLRNHSEALLELVKAARDMRDCKGRYHTEQSTNGYSAP